ncbi:MAG TPA: hypothetical protein VNO14_09595, partial [Blastocatellia bacterium]|nr:hypothetical protein [Blastocatellia bacterium]
MYTKEEAHRAGARAGHLARLDATIARKPVQIAASFALVFAVMCWIEFAGPAILDNDGYYHIRWARMLRESAPELPRFTHLPLTTLAEQDYVDHHYLFHVLLIPFTYGDMRTGAKLAAALFSSLAVASLFALLVAYRVPYRWAWLVPLVASSEPFLYRMSMTRAPALSILLLGAGAYVILERRHVWLAAISFLFVWTYSLFPLILAFAAAHTIAVYLAERRIDLWAVAASLGGVLGGMVINPYFPKNWALLYEHLAMKLTSRYSVDVGIEWYPYETWTILGGSAVAFALYFVALAAFDYRERLRDVKPLFFLIVSTMFLLMAFKSRRFIEYWPPFAVLFAAFTLGPALRRARRAWAVPLRDRVIRSAAAAAAVTVSLAVMGMILLYAREDVQREANPFAYQGASEWIRSHTPAGSIIFNTDWDDFPMLFYYNPDNAYTA